MIFLELQPNQLRALRKGASQIELTRQQALSVRGKLGRAYSPGRAKVLRACRWCGVEMGTAQLRLHQGPCGRSEREAGR